VKRLARGAEGDRAANGPDRLEDAMALRASHCFPRDQAGTPELVAIRLTRAVKELSGRSVLSGLRTRKFLAALVAALVKRPPAKLKLSLALLSDDSAGKLL